MLEAGDGGVYQLKGGESFEWGMSTGSDPLASPPLPGLTHPS